MSRIIPHLFFLLALACFTIGLCASEIIDVPDWCLRGILAVETSSYYRTDGSIAYINHRTSSAGAIGATQIKSIALRTVHLSSMRYQIATEPGAAEYAATIYLRWLYRRTGSWPQAVAWYGVGPDGDADDGRDYLRRVLSASRIY